MNDDEEKIQRRKQQFAEDKSLWKEITKDVKPIDRHDILISKALLSEKSKHESKPKPHVRVQEIVPELQRSQRLKNRDLDGRTEQRLRKGKIEIEARLDLHGMTQIQAYDALMMFIRKVVAHEMRCVLVITGKGTRRTGEQAEQSGVLQQRVPEWLNEPKMHEHILKTQVAQPKDGGSGALYVYLRRRRD